MNAITALKQMRKAGIDIAFHEVNPYPEYTVKSYTRLRNKLIMTYCDGHTKEFNRPGRFLTQILSYLQEGETKSLSEICKLKRGEK